MHFAGNHRELKTFVYKKRWIFDVNKFILYAYISVFTSRINNITSYWNTISLFFVNWFSHKISNSRTQSYSRTCIQRSSIKSRFILLQTCFRPPPLLSSRGHPAAVLCISFLSFVIFSCIKRSPVNENWAICHFMWYFIVFKMRPSSIQRNNMYKAGA